MKSARRQRGFTLLELVVSLCIVGVLAVLAYPSFADALHRSRRADAWSALGAVQLAQERHRSHHTQYAGSIDELPVGSLSSAGHYRMRVLAADRRGYTLLAEPATGSPQRRDRACQRMQIVVQNNRQSATAWDADGIDSTRRCFVA